MGVVLWFYWRPLTDTLCWKDHAPHHHFNQKYEEYFPQAGTDILITQERVYSTVYTIVDVILHQILLSLALRLWQYMYG